MKVYLAGAMRGHDDLNAPAFAAAADALRQQGHEVFNPAAANLAGWGIRKIMAYELAWICNEADAVALLQGWQVSLGARTEHELAKAIGIEIIYL